MIVWEYILTCETARIFSCHRHRRLTFLYIDDDKLSVMSFQLWISYIEGTRSPKHKRRCGPGVGAAAVD